MSDYIPYEPKTWESREFITRIALNHIEQGISDISSEIIRLESVMATLTYEPIKIISLQVTPNIVEIGSEVLAYTINESTNKVPITLTINNEVIEPVQTVTIEEEVSAGEEITSNKTWTFIVTDEEGAEDIKSVTLSFLNKAYWGAAVAPMTIDSSFILSLSNSTLTTSRARSINVNAGEEKYIWYAIPSTFGNCSFKVGGFDGGFSKVSTFNHTNASGHTDSYDVYRSDNAALGTTSVIIS